MRALYAVGSIYLLACAWTFATHESSHLERPLQPLARPAQTPAQPPCRATRYGSDEAKQWFCSVRAKCNSVEVNRRLKHDPGPNTWDGRGYAAACYALAGRLDEARRQIEAAPSAERARASAIVFEIGHPIADAGDDVAAGGIMELVLEFWPQNYQARYHAGMSAYALGQPESAERHLRQFRREYTQNDFFGTNADKALARLSRGLGPDTDNPGAH